MRKPVAPTETLVQELSPGAKTFGECKSHWAGCEVRCRRPTSKANTAMLVNDFEADEKEQEL
jgi:hypothetical protein